MWQLDMAGTCSACTPGFSRPLGLESCEPCAIGSAQSQEGGGYCVTCEAGRYVDFGGSVRCFPCMPGTSAYSTGLSSRSQQVSRPSTPQSVCNLCRRSPSRHGIRLGSLTTPTQAHTAVSSRTHSAHRATYILGTATAVLISRIPAVASPMSNTR